MNTLIITQGNTENPVFRLKYNGQPITASDVKKVEFAFGSVIKTYPESVEYDAELGAFRARLEQEDTFKISSSEMSYQIRMYFNDKNVKATAIFPMLVNSSISKVVLV